MPAYVITLTVPAGTKQEKPAYKLQEFEQSVIVRMEVFFPPGCRGTVYTRCLFGNTQIAPANPGEAFSGSGETISFPDFFIIPYDRAKLRFEAWSPSARYDHTIQWRVYTLPLSVALPLSRWEVLFSRIERLLEIFRV